MYPISAVLVSEPRAGWLTEDGFAHISTFGGAELGCVAALKTLEITSRPEVRSMVHYIADLSPAGCARSRRSYPDWFTGIRQNGVVMGLEFDHPAGRQVRDAAPLRERGLGDLLHPRPPGAAVQAGHPAHPGGCARNCSSGPRSPSRRPGTTRPRGHGRDREPPISVRELLTDPAGVPRARAMLQRARVGRRAPSPGTTRPRCDGSSRPPPRPGQPGPREYAEWAVRETGFGVVEHKVLKNLACSPGSWSATRATTT